MLNRYPWWKNLVIVGVLVLGALYATPNLFRPDPAVQITPISSGDQVSPGALKEAKSVLDQAGIEYFGEEISERLGLLRLKNEDQQLQAKALIQQALGDRYITAINLAPTTPDWLFSLGAKPMTLGLDLSGGVHFLLEVDMEEFLVKRLKDYQSDVKKALREDKLRYSRSISNQQHQLIFTFRDLDILEKAQAKIRTAFPEFIREVKEEQRELVLTLTEQKLRELEDYALKQNLQSLRNRVNELGVAEPLVQRQGRNRIVVELPGVQDTAAAKKSLVVRLILSFV
jgi:preprotein translocase subunit SecD